MADNEENTKTLIEVTGLDRASALKVLLFKQYNLEHAINYILDGGAVPDLPPSFHPDIAGPSTSYAHQPSTSLQSSMSMPPRITDDDDVRPPIPPKRETMLLPEEDNFRFRKRRNITHNLCPLRNFEREGELLEEEMLGDKAKTRKRVRLEDIFRPPIDICYWGPFQASREYGTEQNRWLIVNLQDQTEFLSQCLNRDVWSNIRLKNIIKKYFVFWQVSVDSMEGVRFKTFYCVKRCPFICIIDPRTGEHKHTIKIPEMHPEKYINNLLIYLQQNGPYPLTEINKGVSGFYAVDFSDIDGTDIPNDMNSIDEPSTSAVAASTSAACASQTIQIESSLPSTSSGTNYNKILFNQKSSTMSSMSVLSKLQNEQILSPFQSAPTYLFDNINISNTINNNIIINKDLIKTDDDNIKIYKKKSFDKLTEDEQIELAIKNSLNNDEEATMENDRDDNNIDNGGLSEDGGDIWDTDTFNNDETFEDHLGSKTDPITKLSLRLPNDQREILELPCTSTLRALKLYVCNKYPELTKGEYKILVSTFPKRDVLELNDKLTLKEADLHPVAVLYIHPDD